MAYKITDACTNCGTCESECPVSAISEKDNARWIDPDICIDCGVSCTLCALKKPSSLAEDTYILGPKKAALRGGFYIMKSLTSRSFYVPRVSFWRNFCIKLVSSI